MAPTSTEVAGSSDLSSGVALAADPAIPPSADPCLGGALADGSSVAVEATRQKKKLNLLGFEISATEQGAKTALVGAGALLLVINGIGLPFILPKMRRFLGAPYVPMKHNVVEALFDRVLPAWAAAKSGNTAGKGQLPLAGLRLVDFGSGDGRVVAAAAARGMRAVGYEPSYEKEAFSVFRPIGHTSSPGIGLLR